MNSLLCRRLFVAVITLVPLLVAMIGACTDGGRSAVQRTPESDNTSDSDMAGVTDTPVPVVPQAEQVLRTPALCPHLFEPSLAPVERPKIRRRNRARDVQRLRSKIERVDVVQLSTFRVLFALSKATLESLRRTPKDQPIDWSPHHRTEALPPWDVALLVYVAGDATPYLGHYFDDGDLYFVDEDDPWDPAIFDANMKLRAVYGIPTEHLLGEFLTRQLGEQDPFGHVRERALRLENARCGRVSSPHGDPFPHLPKALIEPIAGDCMGHEVGFRHWLSLPPTL